MGIKNWLTVQITSDSYLLGETIPIEIRDSRLNLVKQMRRGQRVELDDGLYEISAVLEDGLKHRRLVHMQGGYQGDITLDAQETIQSVSPPLPRARMATKRSAETHNESGLNFTVGGNLDGAKVGPDIYIGPSSVSAPEKVVLLYSHGAVLREKLTTTEGESSWVFEPSPNLDDVPRADFLIQGRKITISLPVNPGGYYPFNACEVVKIMNDGPSELRAWIARERTVASTMQHMLASGYILHAASVANNAVDLLRDKYQDPTGALLGALLLQKIGQLESRRDWVRNLATDFDWLNDGKVLLALLLSREEAQKDEALSLALRASSKALMFTESYSLLLDLLRRWPWPGKEDERNHALSSLAVMAPYTNWDSMMVCQVNPEEE